MRVEWLEHKGKKILFIDYNGIKDQDELIKVMYQGFEMIEQSLDKVLTLTDVSDTATGPEFMREVKVLGEKHADKFDKAAILGVVGMKRLMLKGYNAFTKTEMPNKPFETKEEALDYLVS